jgi:hypothetical protein
MRLTRVVYQCLLFSGLLPLLALLSFGSLCNYVQI